MTGDKGNVAEDVSDRYPPLVWDTEPDRIKYIEMGNRKILNIYFLNEKYSYVKG